MASSRLRRTRISIMSLFIHGTIYVAIMGFLGSRVYADGVSVYQRNCGSCHDGGIGGAPKMGDVQGWKERIASGADNLTKSVIDGIQGYDGVMPPRGGNPKLTDAEIRSAVDYIILRSR